MTKPDQDKAAEDAAEKYAPSRADLRRMVEREAFLAGVSWAREHEVGPLLEKLETQTHNVNELNIEYKIMLDALWEIDRQCSRHDTTAWAIANDALDKLQALKASEVGK